MTDLLDSIGTTVKNLAGDWAKYAALGSFALYAAGYLALRFHLSVLGLATDLSVLDERYVFAGARFLMYLVAALPSVLMVALIVGAIAWVASRVVPQATRATLAERTMRPVPLLVVGTAVALVAQAYSRQCFLLHDLLLGASLPEQPDWAVALLLHPENLPLYFDALVAACVVSLVCLRKLYATTDPSNAIVAGRTVLAVLCAIQVLLLPINFGSLIIDKTLARVTPATVGVTAGQATWLVWEGKSGATFLVCTPDTRPCSLLTRPTDKSLPIEVVGTNAIVPTLFNDGRARKAPPGTP